MELQPRPRDASIRCPYCHDALLAGSAPGAARRDPLARPPGALQGGAASTTPRELGGSAARDGGPPSDELECLGCGTSHHLACVAEVGRCTVLGCERPFFPAALERARAGASRSSAYLAVRRRIRERVRSFVREHARPRSAAALEAELEAARTAATAAEGRGDPAAWAEALRAQAATIEAARGLDLAWSWRADPPDGLRARARRLEERLEVRRALRSAARLVAVSVAVALAALAALTLDLRGC